MVVPAVMALSVYPHSTKKRITVDLEDKEYKDVDNNEE